MIPVEALEFALSKEVYQRLYNDHPQLKDVFLFLMGEEQKHKQLIEKKIYELTK